MFHELLKQTYNESKLLIHIETILADQSIYNIEALENLATSFRVICAAVPSLGWGRGEIYIYKYKV